MQCVCRCEVATAAEQSGACALGQAATLEILKSWEGGSDVWLWAWALRTALVRNSSAMHHTHNEVSHSTAALKAELADTQAHTHIATCRSSSSSHRESVFIIYHPESTVCTDSHAPNCVRTFSKRKGKIMGLRRESQIGENET